jgi:hypothetical protein
MVEDEMWTLNRGDAAAPITVILKGIYMLDSIQLDGINDILWSQDLQAAAKLWKMFTFRPRGLLWVAVRHKIQQTYLPTA